MTNRLALYPCPGDMKAGEDVEGDRTCGRNFPSKNGAVMHAVNTDDEHHNRVKNKDDASQHVVELTVDASGDTTTEETPTPSTDEGTGDAPTEDVRDPEIPPADDDGGTDPGSTDDQTDDQTVDCPNCDADLQMTEQEVREFLEEHGEAYCPTCGYEVKDDE